MSDSMDFGTKKVGYVEAKYGPFKCGRCDWFLGSLGACHNPEVMADRQVPQHAAGDMRYAKVEADACCNEWRPKGK